MAVIVCHEHKVFQCASPNSLRNAERRCSRVTLFPEIVKLFNQLLASLARLEFVQADVEFYFIAAARGGLGLLEYLRGL